LHEEIGEGAVLLFRKGWQEMLKFTLATAVLRFKRPSMRTVGAIHDPVHEAMHARTRSRAAVRRLRASSVHDPYVDLAPLDLTRRH
jgi:hypothetical protein